ncbi:MAG: GreA/GreB family elongation factor [Dehalococcoidia bacterium]
MTVPRLSGIIFVFVENRVEHDPTLAEAAHLYLASLPQEQRPEVQAEVLKFVRWLGSSRRVRDITPLDVASYGDHVIPSAVKPIKAFLTYTRKKGLTQASLSVHIRARKVSAKVSASRLPPGAGATLTPEGYAELEAELAGLKSQLPGIIKEIQRAAADKDFKENAPLAAAREQKAHLEGRIQELESTLNTARIMDKSRAVSKVKSGDTVVLRNLDSGRELRYILVDPREANPAKGKLSVASPLGKVVVGKENGQTVEVSAPAGTFRYHIESILEEAK